MRRAPLIINIRELIRLQADDHSAIDTAGIAIA